MAEIDRSNFRIDRRPYVPPRRPAVLDNEFKPRRHSQPATTEEHKPLLNTDTSRTYPTIVAENTAKEKVHLHHSSTAGKLPRQVASLMHSRSKRLPYKKNIPKFVYSHLQTLRLQDRRIGFRTTTFSVIAVLGLVLILPLWENRWQADAYAMSAADSSVIAKPNEQMANDLKHDIQSQTYNFNSRFSPMADTAKKAVQYGGAQIQATLHDDPSKGITVSDPYSQANFTITPEFSTMNAKQQKNQVEYPFLEGNGNLIYTAEAGGVKEDLLIHHFASNSLKFKYKLGLGDQYTAFLKDDGSLDIYGSSLPIYGNVSTASAKDAQLLAKARQNAAKDKLLFELPPPIIHEMNNHRSIAQARFSLNNDELTVTATNLNNAVYPLSIDPSVSVSTISDFFRQTNVETNADFDAANNQIKRGIVTGGSFATWAATSSSMTQSRFLAGSTIYNGYAYVVGGAAAATTSNYTGASYVEYGSITAGTPSTISWANGNSTGLPAGGLSRFKLVAYNGYLYAIDGSTTDTTCATVSSTVYYTTIQKNGVLSNWSSISGPTTARCALGATAYNGYLYVAGGKTGSAVATGTTDVSYAQILPNGTLGTWNTTSALSTATYGGDLLAYNNYLYYVQGNQNGTLTLASEYMAIASTGAAYNTTWTTSAFSAGNFRENFGANFTAIHNGYLYESSACSAENASQSCSTFVTNSAYAQINADGSLGQWTNIASNTLTRVGSNLATWNGTIYNISGCSSMNVGAVQCTTAVATQQYAAYNTAGTVGIKLTAANTVPTALFASASAVANGYMYVVGGCLTNSCQSGTADTSNAVYYSKINSDGRPAAWSTSAFTINGTTGVAATSLVAINNVLYALGGYTYAAGGNNTIWTASINTGTGDVTANWAVNATTITNASYAGGALSQNGNIYIFGGCNAGINTYGCNTYFQTVAKASVTGTTIGAFSTTSLSQLGNAVVNVPNAAFGLAFYYNYIYLCGGSNSNAAGNGGAQTTKCVYAKLLANGTISSGWTITTGSMNQTIRRNAAYAINGYMYVFGGFNGQTNAIVGDVNVGQINSSTGDIASFSLSSTTITGRWDITGFGTSDYIYAIGGCTTGNAPASCTAASTAVEYFRFNNASNGGTRTVATNTARIVSNETGQSAAVYNGYLYLAGGCVTYVFATQKCSSADNDSMYALLNPDGSTGTFTSGPTLPVSSYAGQLQAVSGNLYFMGGATGVSTTAKTAVFKSVIGANGVPGAWDNGVQTALPNAEYGLSSAVFNNVIYVTGGLSGTTYATTVWHSTISSGNITAWTTDTAFTTARAYHSTVVAAGYLYVLGGFNSTSALSDVQFIQLTTSGGTTGSWNYTHDLPQILGQAGAQAANGYIYMMGGSTGTASASNCQSQVYYAPVNANGTLGDWSLGTSNLPNAFTEIASAYYNGNFYTIGGNPCANGAGENFVYITGEQSQAIRATFSRYIDLVGDATPESLVANGTNAQISSTDIETWRLRYYSTMAATNAWGNVTTVSPIPFGSSTTSISAIDGSSVNQGLSRYWLFVFDIDQATTFGFSDSTQPTIIRYDFYYGAATSTRLRNGKNFQDQTQQSLDAHP